MPKIKITRYKGTTDSGTGKKKTLQVTLGNKKGATTLTRSVSKDAGKKITERSIVRNLRQGASVKKTKEDGVKTKAYRTMVDRDGGKTYIGEDKKMFKAANKLNKVVHKRGRAADLQALRPTGETVKSLSKFPSPAKPGRGMSKMKSPEQTTPLYNDLESVKNRVNKKAVDYTRAKQQAKKRP